MVKKVINVVVAVILVALLATVIYLIISKDDYDDEERKSGDDKNTEEEQKINKGEEQEQYYVFDVVPYVTLRYSGFDGMGTASVQIDHDGLWMLEEDLYKTITSPQKTGVTDPSDASNDDESSSQGEENAEFDRKYLEEFKHVFDTMAFVADRTTDLTNGDSVTVKITIDEELAKKCKITLEKKEYTYTVSGLTAMQSVDPFEGLVVKLSGSETNTVVMIDDSACSDFIRNYVVFEYDKRDAYYNGDHFSVYAKWGDNFHLNNEETVYVFSKDEMDVEVSGLNMYPKTIENIDLTSVLKADWDVINGTIIDYLYNELNLTGPLDEYNHKRKKSFEDILDFHVRFEQIHPFQDGNGRVGRLLMFKECLASDIVPFIITDDLKMFYYRGLREWGHINGYLKDTCLTAQDMYKELLKYFRIKH